ncbi:hypothetical protein Nepgr_033766 [Nepenthes gracilis]|uniref:Uncharacterized protein n=1 Tax=Nepenthes gracilis TaxID=150966 RepID=A0AAD3TN11_NEPGR|nr:hypothetical protein Nepgr_033766 [Nepenthes gracilis]
MTSRLDILDAGAPILRERHGDLGESNDQATTTRDHPRQNLHKDGWKEQDMSLQLHEMGQAKGRKGGVESHPEMGEKEERSQTPRTRINKQGEMGKAEVCGNRESMRDLPWLETPSKEDGARRQWQGAGSRGRRFEF